jgi:hypothetical protein
LPSFGSSLEQYKQSINSFDGLEASLELNQTLNHIKVADRPGWYNRIPVAYIQRIVIKSILKISTNTHNDTPFMEEYEKKIYKEQQKKYNKKLFKNSTKKDDKFYLIDAFRTPLGQLFDVNSFIQNFKIEKNISQTNSNDQIIYSSSNVDIIEDVQSLLDDMCVHIGELNNHNNKDILPEFNCLYLSPANFWMNDKTAFSRDDDIMKTINFQKNKLKQNYNDNNDNNNNNKENDQNTASLLDKFKNLFRKRSIGSSTDIRDLLFGIPWPITLTLLKDDPKLMKNFEKISNYDENEDEQSTAVVLTYSITIAFRNYNKHFINQLKRRLGEQFFNSNLDSTINDYNNDDDDDNDVIYNLKYTKHSYSYYVPYIVLYLLLFTYIYISVRKIEFVKVIFFRRFVELKNVSLFFIL